MNHSSVTRRAWSACGRIAAAGMAAAALVVLAAACGGSRSSTGSSGGSNAGGSTNSLSQNSQLLAYAQCMRSRGVSNFPDPNSNGQFDKATLAQLAHSDSHFLAASRGCSHLLPTETVTDQRDQAATALRFSECMRAHGVRNFPDPASDGRIPDPASFGIDQGSGSFEAANQACQNYRPLYIPSNAAYNAYARAHGA
jgi:hypothetical protein